MKIIYFIDFIHTPGGMERVLCLKANYLVQKASCQVTIVTLSKETNPFFELDSSIQIISLDLRDSYPHTSQWEKLIVNKYYAPIHKQKVEEIIYSIKPDICISFFGLEYYFLHEIQDGSKKIVEIHNSRSSFLIIANQGKFGFLKKLYKEYQLKFIQKLGARYDKIVVLTKKDLTAWNFSNGLVIANPTTFSSSNNFVNDYSQKRVLAVGRISFQKGYEYLVDAWEMVHQKYPDWSLTILGRRKDTHDTLEQYITTKNVGKSILVQEATNEVIRAFYQHSIFVMSSRYEGFPMVLLEAASCGLPLVAFDCPSGPSELITNNKNGFLVNYLDINDLADKLMHVMKDEKIRNQMGTEAKLTVKKYTIDLIIDKWLELFKKSISK